MESKLSDINRMKLEKDRVEIKNICKHSEIKQSSFSNQCFKKEITREIRKYYQMSKMKTQHAKTNEMH